MSVYGDMLSAFNELYDTYLAFNALPEVVAGLVPNKNAREIRGILINATGGELGISGDTLNDVQVPVFFTKATLQKETYIADMDEDKHIYKVVKDNRYKKIANFNSYILETVTGVDGSQKTNQSVLKRLSTYG